MLESPLLTEALNEIVSEETYRAIMLTDPAERALYDYAEEIAPVVEAFRESHRYQEALEQIATLRPHVDLFFDKVMVMVDDPALRQNRLALISKVLVGFSSIADFYNKNLHCFVVYIGNDSIIAHPILPQLSEARTFQSLTNTTRIF